MPTDQAPPPSLTNHLARVVLATFLFTFIAARTTVLLIMLRWIPDMYLYAGTTHVHHLNYGIFLLSAVGAFLIFSQPKGGHLTFAAIVYAIGLALTFDEFGMWLHLGGPYWQRASFDAIVVIAAMLGLIAYAPAIKHLRPRHFATAVLVLLAVGTFGFVLAKSMKFANEKISPILQQIEASGPVGS